MFGSLGIVSVRVSNDSKLWSPTAASFTYEDRNAAPAHTTAASVSPTFDFGMDEGKQHADRPPNLLFIP